MTPSAKLDYDVVIPTHGRSLEHLEQALASIRSQTVPARQVIVVVDGNQSAAHKLRDLHPDILVLEFPTSRGPAAARQFGIEASSAEWVSLLDDDDLWSPRKQAATAEYLAAHPECEAVRAGYWIFASPDCPFAEVNGQQVELRAMTLGQLEQSATRTQPLNDLSYLDIQGDSLGKMLEFNRGVTSTTTVRRTVLLHLAPVPEDQRNGNDYLLFCHIAAETEWHLIRDRLAYYRVHGGQVTRIGAQKAAGLIMAKRRAWNAHGSGAPRELASYGKRYRQEVRNYLWAFTRRRHFREALRIYSLAKPLLPRRRDRVAAIVPTPVVWHAQRWLERVGGHVQDADRRNPEW